MAYLDLLCQSTVRWYMRDWRATIGALLLLFAIQTQGQQNAKWVLLPSKAADASVGTGTWQPTDANIADANSALPQISGLIADNWKNPLIRIDHPEAYFRQYVPTLHNGAKTIYVNAFCDEKPPVEWRLQLVVVSDGGTCYWQALFDPITKKYSHLTVNGRA